MSDVVDDAQAYNELHQQVSLANQRAKLVAEYHPEFDGVHCVECGEDMPPPRLLLKRVRCVPCQEELEARARQYAR